MTKVCARLAAIENRGFTRSEEKMKELEDHLVDEIVRELHANPSKLSLVHGGKEIETKKRQSKSSTKTEKVGKKILEFKPVLN
jgi:predicted secreted protein